MTDSPLEQAVTAIRNENCDALRTLVRANPGLIREADPQHRDYTLLLHAGHYYSEEVVRILIDAGSEVHATSRDGATPFSNAIAKCESGEDTTFFDQSKRLQRVPELGLKSKVVCFVLFRRLDIA